MLALVNNPFIVPLKFSFQNPDKLYLVMSFGEYPHISMLVWVTDFGGFGGGCGG